MVNRKPDIITDCGTRIWINGLGERHREDGPAIIWGDGTEHWYKKNMFHREDGPAIIDGHLVLWFVNDHRIHSYKKFQEMTGHSDEYITYLKLKWGKIS